MEIVRVFRKIWGIVIVILVIAAGMCIFKTNNDNDKKAYDYSSLTDEYISNLNKMSQDEAYKSVFSVRLEDNEEAQYIRQARAVLKDKIEYNNLCMKYDCLFDYFKDVEDNLDDVSLTNHEYKNQLAVIKGYIENNKQGEAIKYINDIVNDNSEVDSNIISELKNIPKGGIKGLLYYKIITAHSRNVTPVLNISNDSKKYLKKLTSEENRVISKVLGVYIDNAIESASLLDKKFITIEIYSLGNIINFVISNQFKPEISDITRVSEKGYSTKGKGHGKGTYLINKIIKKTNWVHTERKIIKNFYIQKISVIK